MASETAVPTHCPTCGAKIARPELSLCAYCGSPVGLERPAAPDDESARRLARMREMPEFIAASAWTPVPPQIQRSERRARAAGWTLMLLAAAWIAVSLARGEPWLPTQLGMLAAWLLLLAGAILLMAARSARRRDLARPMLKRPAIVLDRRSETAMRGGTGATVYFFTLRFDDGGEGEFRFPGRGALYDLMAVGTTGVAYTRGAELVDFQRLRA